MSAASVRHRSRGWGRPGGLVVLLGAVLLAGCGRTPPPKPDRAVEVVVTTPISDSVLDYQDFTGRLDAFRTVEIRARVTGYVDDAPFKEGDLVKKGDTLFLIDSRTYRADLAQAVANLKLAQTDRDLQDLNASRARRMMPSRAIGKEEYDQIMANREKSRATVGSMEAARDRALLYVDYTNVIAPISGRISRRSVDPGNLVKADDTLLTTIVADEPVYAYFDVDERTYLDLVGEKPSPSSSSSPASSVRLQELKFPVLMRLANEEEFIHPGFVDFVDNRLNGSTGTIRMRGVFKNPRGALKSGLFVRVRLPIGTPYQALLVPDEALQSDQGRKYVYVVDRDDKVEYRTVTLGQALNGLRVLKQAKKDNKGKVVEGVVAGERIIISGMQRVRKEMEVKAKMQPPPKKPESPLRKLLHREQVRASDQATR
jgi:RND family efflux transporter MFP subunit